MSPTASIASWIKFDMMRRMVEPFVTLCQGSIVTFENGTFGSMSANQARMAFASRLNEICDDMKIPPKDQGRQVAVAKLFGVSQKGARKWLEGEGYPTDDKKTAIALWADVSYEWLNTGRGPKMFLAPEVAYTPQIVRVVQAMQKMSHDNQATVVKISDSLAESNGGSKPAGSNNK